MRYIHSNNKTDKNVSKIANISTVSCNPTRSEQVCVQLPTSADNVALPAFAAAVDRSPARRAHSSKPAAAACGGRMLGQTDRGPTIT